MSSIKLELRRQDALAEVVSAQKLTKQEDLVEALRTRGLQATQSSVSRDLKQLGVRKQGGYYRLPPAQEDPVLSSVLSALPAGPHLLVIKTLTGAAQRVAYAIDDKKFSFVVGTVAGDDTVFVATPSAKAQGSVIAWLGVTG